MYCNDSNVSNVNQSIRSLQYKYSSIQCFQSEIMFGLAKMSTVYYCILLEKSVILENMEWSHQQCDIVMWELCLFSKINFLLSSCVQSIFDTQTSMFNAIL